MIKIAYCVPYLWNPGGVDRVITVKANYLADRLGYDVTIITCDQQGIEPYFPLSPKVKMVDLGVNFYKYKGKAYSRLKDIMVKVKRSTYQRMLFRRRLAKALATLQPDITICVSRRELPFLYKIKAGGIKIAERHLSRNNRLLQPSSLLMKCLNRYLTEREDMLVGRYDCAVTLTEEDKELWRNNSRMRVIPNPVTEVPVGVSKLDTKTVVAVGRISLQKGFDRLVDAWSRVEAEFPDWQLKIVGSQTETDQTAKLKAEISRLGLKNVTLLPNTHSIGKVYREASAVALTSRYEGLPLVLLEAMASGVPCIAMACQCGPRDIISDGVTGLLVPEGDVEAFASALKRLMSNDEQRKQMGAAALRRSADFSLPAIMGQWDKLFNHILEK